jgi:hypothetical protein
VVQLRKHPQELGCIREDEGVVLRTLLETFISRAWCLRQPCDDWAMLTLSKIKNLRWADYWQQQAYAVMLVISTSDGEIRWMDVSAYLKREGAGRKTVRQIAFEDDLFDVVSVWRWREKVLSGNRRTLLSPFQGLGVVMDG